jgi:hypothetical protein
LAEWKNFMKALHFVGTGLSDRDVRLCFVMSRM